MKKLLVLLMFIPLVTAIAITPAKTTLTEPGPFTFTPLHEGDVTVRVVGDMADYVELDAERVLKGETVTGRLTAIPEAAPGSHVQMIIITPVDVSGQGTVSAVAEVATQLIVQIPRDGPYIDGDFSVSNDPGSDSTLATIMLENLGSESVLPERVRLSVDDANVRQTFSIDPKVIEPLTIEKFEDRFKLDGTPGEYTVRVEVPYAESQFEKEKLLVIGTPEISIDSVTYHGEEQGAIKPLDIAGRIKWNVPIEAEVRVSVDGNPVVVSRESVSNTYDIRVYLETIPVETIHVTVSARGVSANEQVQVEEPEVEEFPWIWVAVLILIIIAWVGWRIFSFGRGKDINRGEGEGN